MYGLVFKDFDLVGVFALFSFKQISRLICTIVIYRNQLTSSFNTGLYASVQEIRTVLAAQYTRYP